MPVDHAAAMLADAPASAPASAAGPRRRWPLARRALGWAFLALVAVLLVQLGRGLDWAAAWVSVKALPATTLGGAAALAAVSHALYCCYDLLGRHITGHTVPVRKVMAVGFISYAFNLNLGSLVGGVAMRYRLYAQQGLGAEVVTRVLTLSMLSNWLGYLLVGGVVLLVRPPAVPPGWGALPLPVLGAVMLALVGAYLVLCFAASHRVWTLRGHDIQPPPGRIALLQLGVSSINWMTIAAVVTTLLQGRIDYASVLGVLLVAAVAGVITHVPAGLGVLEAVFLTLLSQRLPAAELLGALLAYRVIYYLVPLALACVLNLLLKKPSPHGQAQPLPNAPARSTA